VIEPLAKLIARQLGRPSGLIGPAMGPILDRGNRQINQTAVERLDVGPTDEVLEVGFGGGGAIARLLTITHGRVTGVEISEPMLRKAHRRFRRQLEEGRVELRNGDVMDLPFPDDSFDRVLSVNTIYFWPEAVAGLRETLRVLLPGGRLVLATDPAERMRQRSYTQHGFRFFDDAELEALLSAAGFSDVRVARDDGRVYSSAIKHGGLSG
jgi:arsenite methyltransferase